MVAACVVRFGRVDILVNNVGSSAEGGAVALPEENWDRQMEVNLKTVFLTCKHVILHMEGQGGGAIVNTASTSGLRFTGAAQVAYAAAKAGIIHFSRVSAVEYVPKGIRIKLSSPARCTPRWLKRGWPVSAPAGTSTRFWWRDKSGSP